MRQLSLFPEPVAIAAPVQDTQKFDFQTFVSYPARAVNAPDGLRIEFSIPVHADLLPFVTADRREIPCKARCWKGFKWGQLGRGAEIRIVAKLDTGSRGGQYLYCSRVDILKGAARTGPKLPKKIIQKLEKQHAS